MVAQTPVAPEQPWIATAAGPAGSCCVLATDAPLGADATVRGLVLDTWTEALPRPGDPATEVAAIAFQSARPDARPPQALLLAVPPDPERGWRAEDLHATVQDALELAAVRGLDLTDLPELRGPLPPVLTVLDTAFPVVP